MKPRRQRGWRVLEAFYKGQVCYICGRPYDPYQGVESRPSTKDATLIFGFVHQACRQGDPKDEEPQAG